MKFRFSLRLLALGFVLYGCNLLAPGGGKGHDLTGALVDVGGAPAAGVTVRMYPHDSTLAKGLKALPRLDSAVTDSSGRFRFKDLPEGRYNLEATIRLGDSTYGIFVPGLDFEGSLKRETDTLRATGTLSLRIRDEAGQAAAGHCTIAESPWTAASDLSGTCWLEGLPPGTYTVSVTAPGFAPVDVRASVASGTVTEAGSVTLAPPVESWTLMGAQGYSYRIPPLLAITAASEDSPSDPKLWFAWYGGPPVSLIVGLDMVEVEARPDTFPGYSKVTAFEDASVRAERISYLSPHPPGFLDSMHVDLLTIRDKASGSVLLRFATRAWDPGERAIAERILATVQKQTGTETVLRTPPFVPALLSPGPDSQGVSLNPTLSWAPSNSPDYYHLQVSADSLFSSLAFEDSLITGTSRNLGPLALYTKYYWRLRARKSPFVTAYSETRSFTTRALEWTTRTAPQRLTLTDAAWSGTRYIVTSAPTDFSTGDPLYSTDGATWTPRGGSSNEMVYGVRLWKGLFVIPGSFGAITTTTDGVLADGYIVESGKPLYDITDNGSLLVIGGTGKVYTATAVATWTGHVLAGTTGQVNALAWTGSLFVAALSDGTLYTSPDGITWTARTSGTTKALYGLAAGPRGIVAVGAEGILLRSPDGVTWTSGVSGTTKTLRGVAVNGNDYVAVGANGSFLYSSDAVLWKQKATPSQTEDLRFVQRAGSLWITGGTNGLLMTAP